jgi:hypothetical protein
MMPKTNFVPFVLEHYKNGQRRFEDLDMEDESFEGADLEGIIFDRCLLYVSFRGANLKNTQFLNGGIKTCDFREADLTNAHFENLSVEGAEFARASIENTFFDNNWAYGQTVTQADFDDWIKGNEESLMELNTLKETLLQLEKMVEGGNYEPHFQLELVSDSTHVDNVVPEINKRFRRSIEKQELKEVSFSDFKTAVQEKFDHAGDPGWNHLPEVREEINLLQKKFWQLLEQKFHSNRTKFYRCPHDDQWIFWSFSFLIVSKERNRSYLFEGGASD